MESLGRILPFTPDDADEKPFKSTPSQIYKMNDLNDLNKDDPPKVHRPKKDLGLSDKCSPVARGRVEHAVKEYLKGEFEASVKSFSSAIGHVLNGVTPGITHPDAAILYLNRAIVNVRMKQLKFAMSDCELALKYDKRLYQTHLIKGRILKKLKDYSNGELHYLYFLSRHFNLGVSNELRDLQVEALEEEGIPLNIAHLVSSQFDTIREAIDILKKVGPHNWYKKAMAPVKDMFIVDLPSELRSLQTMKPKNEAVGNENSANRKSENILANLGQFKTVRIDNFILTEHPGLDLEQDLKSALGMKQSVHMTHVHHLRETYIKLADSKMATDAVLFLREKFAEDCKIVVKFYPETENTHEFVSFGKYPPAYMQGSGECYYWRIGNCLKGPNCKWLHLPVARGVDYCPPPNYSTRRPS